MNQSMQSGNKGVSRSLVSHTLNLLVSRSIKKSKSQDSRVKSQTVSGSVSHLVSESVSQLIIQDVNVVGSWSFSEVHSQ